MKQREVRLGSIVFSNDRPAVLIGGPCVLETDAVCLKVGRTLKALTRHLGIGYVYKSSYDKANRSSSGSFRGPGLKEGLRRLARIKEILDVPVLTDIHTAAEAAEAAKVADILQIPAFLCRQTDLLVAAGETGAIVNIKKGQFMAPWDMGNAVRKVEATGNRRVMLTERGVMYGYNNLVVDMRSLEIMKRTGCPVIYDATHSVQLPGGNGASSGGQREFVPPLARAATAIGVAGLFMEIHPNPDKALSDGPNSMRLADMKNLLTTLKKLDNFVKKKAG